MMWDLNLDEQAKCLLNDLCCISEKYELEFDARSRATVSDVE